MKYIKRYLLLIILLMASISGCGTDKELEAYKTDMETFYKDISEYDAVINSIDVASETAVTELLSALDGLQECFTWMAALPVPETFEAIEPLAQQAGEYMEKAVSLFHQAYESDPFNNAAAQAAHEYYERANKRAVYILAILHGELPLDNDEEASGAEESDAAVQADGDGQRQE